MAPVKIQFDAVSPESVNNDNLLGTFPNMLGSDMSRLFLSSPSLAPSEQSILSTTDSTDLIDVLNNSSQSDQEKRSTFTGIALKESPSYSSAERVPRIPSHNSSMSKQKSAVIVANGDTSFGSDESEDAELIEDETLEPLTPLKNKRDSQPVRKASRRASVAKRKKSRASKKGADVLQSEQPNVKSHVSKAKSAQQLDNDGVPSIEISLPDQQSKTKVSRLSFKESLREVEKQETSNEKILTITQCFSTCKKPSEYFKFIKTFDKFVNELEDEPLEVEDVEQVISIASDLYESNEIDTAHFTELLKCTMKCDTEDSVKFNILTSIIKVNTTEKRANGDPGVTKEFLMEILPFLVHDDEEIKERAFKELSEMADINTQEDLRELLVGLNVLPDTCKADDIDIASSGKILNIQYWKNEIGSPMPNVPSKTSEELQIVSEFEVSVNQSNISLPKESKSVKSKSNLSLTYDSKSNSTISQKQLSVGLVGKESPQPTLTPPASLAGASPEPPESLGATLDRDGSDGEESDLVHFPSVDIKRRIVGSDNMPVMIGNQNIGAFRDEGKLYNSTNDFMLWYEQDDDNFYDTDSKVVGSLLPDGSVSVPANVNLVAHHSIIKQGKELVRNAGNCDCNGVIKDEKGVILGKLTKEGEFISRDGILYNCDGVYVGKQCHDENRMYANGEIFDKNNSYWGHVGPDNTMIHLSGVILDSSGIKIGHIEEYGGKLNKCVRNFELDEDKTDSGVSIDDVYTNKELKDEDGGILGKFKNKDTIITTCGDIFDRSGSYLGQLLANGQVMIKEEATKHVSADINRSTTVTKCRSRAVPPIDRSKGLPRKSRADRHRTAVMEHDLEIARLKRRKEIGDEWGKYRDLPSDIALGSDQGYGSEDKLLFDIAQSVPLLPTLNEIKGQRLVKTITFSRSMSSFHGNKNFRIEPMPSKLNAHTTSADGKTHFGMLKVNWTTRSIDPTNNTLPLLLPPPPSRVAAAVVTPPSTVPHLPSIHRRDVHDLVTRQTKTASGDYLMKMASSYLKKELDDEMRSLRAPRRLKSVTIQGKMHTTPILSARKT